MTPSIAAQVTIVMSLLVVGGALIGVSATAMWFSRSTKSFRSMRLRDYGKRTSGNRRRR